jgi:lipopolysaccharide transport system permease protein
MAWAFILHFTVSPSLLGACFLEPRSGCFITPIGMLYNDVAKIISMDLSFDVCNPGGICHSTRGLMKTLMELNR